MEQKEPSRMNNKLLALGAAVLLVGTTSLGYAQSPTQKNAPGQQMQNRGSAPGDPGASGYSPGDRMHDRGSKAGSPGASGYAPGHQDLGTTGRGGGSMGNRDPDRDRGDGR
jgi:hypothetical protein